MIRWLLCLVGAATLAQQPPIPALRPVPAAPTVTIRTNILPAGTYIITTVMIPTENKAYYYGLRSTAIVLLGHWTKAEYEQWAYTGGQTLGNGGGPQIQHWTAVFSTTNRIDPTLVHAKLCP